jgi:hypothetical protein
MTKLEELKAVRNAAYQAAIVTYEAGDAYEAAHGGALLAARDTAAYEAARDAYWAAYRAAVDAYEAAVGAYYDELKKLQEENSNEYDQVQEGDGSTV